MSSHKIKSQSIIQPKNQSINQKSKIPLQKLCSSFENTIRYLLITLVVKEKQSVCDLMSGRGTDIASYMEVKLRKYRGIDPNSEDTKAANAKWTNEQVHKTHFGITLDPFITDIYSKLHLDSPTAKLYDVVACQNRMLTYFVNPVKASKFITNVYNILNPEGYFIGYTIDPMVIFQRINETGLTMDTLIPKLPYILTYGPFSLTIDLRERGKVDSSQQMFTITTQVKDDDKIIIRETYALLSWEQLLNMFNSNVSLSIFDEDTNEDGLYCDILSNINSTTQNPGKTSLMPSNHFRIQNTANAVHFFYENSFNLGYKYKQMGKYFLENDNTISPHLYEFAKTFAIFVIQKC